MAELQRTVMKWPGGVLSFDCVEVEDVDHDGALTEYPVERGANRADHIIIKPIKVRLTVHLSNSPLAMGSNLSHQDGAQPQTSFNVPDKMSRGFKHEPKQIVDWSPLPGQQQLGLTSVAGVQLVVPRPRTLDIYGEEQFAATQVQAEVRAWGFQGDNAQRVQRVLNELKAAHAEGREFTIATQFADYDSMVIRRWGKSRSAKNPRAPQLDIELQQLIVSELERRDISSRFPRKPKQQRSKPAQEAGKQQPKAADEQTKKKKKSVLKAVL
jgi:hypothetical protein